jgi:hypothetical protein
MTDVVEIANERRVSLAAEIGALDDFIRTAEKLLSDDRLELKSSPDTESEDALNQLVTSH